MGPIGALLPVSSSVSRSGQVGRDVTPLDGLQPVDGPFVAVLPELQVRPGIAEVDEMPGGDILDEYQ